MPVEASAGILTTITLLLLVGATGKSAQIPLYVWLPDAMAGPTPVSALIHAATMVTAGVYMIARSAALFMHAPIAMDTVAVIGLATAFFAATIGLAQNDIKKVFAYSTVSQLGYMFLGVGVGAFSAGIFHLMTHAFFKAPAVPGRGRVIHGLHGEQDLRQMGGLFKHMKITAITLFCASLAISGVPVYLRLLQQGRDPGGRLRARAVDVLGGRDHRRHDGVLRFPRLVHGVHRRVSGPRASARIAAGDDRAADDAGGSFIWSAASSTCRTLLEPMFAEKAGKSRLGVAFGRRWIAGHLSRVRCSMSLKRGLADSFAKAIGGLYTLVYNKYFVDEIYDAAVVEPLIEGSRTVLWRGMDAGLIDGTVNGVGRRSRGIGGILRLIQSGNIRSYAAWVVLGSIVLLIRDRIRGRPAMTLLDCGHLSSAAGVPDHPAAAQGPPQRDPHVQPDRVAGHFRGFARA